MLKGCWYLWLYHSNTITSAPWPTQKDASVREGVSYSSAPVVSIPLEPCFVLSHCGDKELPFWGRVERRWCEVPRYAHRPQQQNNALVCDHKHPPCRLHRRRYQLTSEARGAEKVSSLEHLHLRVTSGLYALSFRERLRSQIFLLVIHP